MMPPRGKQDGFNIPTVFDEPKLHGRVYDPKPAAPFPLAFGRMLRLSLIGLLVAAGLLPALPEQTRAQTPPRPDPAAAFAKGRAALEDGRAAHAASWLRTAFATDSSYYEPAHGSAAYWLGRAYDQMDRPEAALRTWARGLTALNAYGTFDAQLSDQFIRRVFERQRVRLFDEAAAAYFDLLRQAGAPLSEADREVVRTHLAALAFVLPPSLRQKTGLPEPSDKEAAPPLDALSADAAAHWIAWWQGQDPLPVTAANERLEEHLERFAYARRHYHAGGRFDDRGRIYLRLGPPYKQTTVDFDDARFRRKVLNQFASLTTFSFPKNEFWIYPHIASSAHYLFAEERRNRYRLAEPEELLPSTMKNGLTSSARGRRKGAALIRAMDELYRQLALYHIDYSSRYQEVADYATMLDMQEFTGGPLRGATLPPSAFAQSTLMRSRTEAWQNTRRRNEAVPQAYSDLLRDVPALPASVRWARFLEPGGTTRTEVYWSAPADALTPPREVLRQFSRGRSDWPQTYLLALTVAQKTDDYRTRQATRARRLVRLDSSSAGGVLAPQTFAVHGDTARYHLALQWDEYVAYTGGRSVRLGPRLREGTFRADSLAPLRPQPGVLEMSDLKPLLVSPAAEAASLGQAPPYPFERVVPETPLGLYFEVYHLTYDSDDRTRYTVEYEVERRSDRNGLARLFRGAPDEERTATRTEQAGTRRTAEEMILLDLDEWDTGGRLRITVRVTDQVTDQTAERAIAFDLAPAAPSEELTP